MVPADHAAASDPAGEVGRQGEALRVLGMSEVARILAAKAPLRPRLIRATKQTVCSYSSNRTSTARSCSNAVRCAASGQTSSSERSWPRSSTALERLRSNRCSVSAATRPASSACDGWLRSWLRSEVVRGVRQRESVRPSARTGRASNRGPRRAEGTFPATRPATLWRSRRDLTGHVGADRPGEAS